MEDDIRNSKLKNISESALKAAGLDPKSIVLEDTLIMDPIFMKTINKYREVMIGSDIFKITDLGVFKCNVNSVLGLRLLTNNQEFREKIIRIVQEIKNRKLSEKKGTLKRLAVDNEEYIVGEDITYIIDPESLEPEPPVAPIETVDPNLPLVLKSDPLFSSVSSVSPTIALVPTSTPTAIMNMSDDSSKSWLGEQLAGVLGYSVECSNYYRSDVRVKTMFWSQNYVLYKSVGMKVKMQNRALGIWWAEKAQELKLGWESVIINSEYDPTPTTINMNFDNKPYYQSVDLYNAMMEKQFKTWRSINWKNWDKPFIELIWFMSDVPDPINKYLYTKSVTWLRDYAKTKIANLNGPVSGDNFAVTFVQPGTITTVLLPRDPVMHTFNHQNEEYPFETEYADWSIGTTINTGGLSQSSPIFYLKESPHNFKIIKGSKIFGIAKWRDSWRGSYILKSED